MYTVDRELLEETSDEVESLLTVPVHEVTGLKGKGRGYPCSSLHV